MASVKSKINFNKMRNKGDKLKAKFRKDKKKEDKPIKEVKEKKQKEKKPRKKGKKSIWYYLLLTVTIGAILMFIIVIIFGIYIVTNAPKFHEDLLFNKDSTIIYGRNGEVLTTLGMNVGGDEVEKRVKVSYDELPEVLIDAVIATEDSRFFQHNGVDLARFIKASIGQLLGNSDAGGASTLTMQVSKNALTDTTSEGFAGIVRKFTDIYLSVFEIEKNYTKQDIFELYVNSEFLGNQAFGVEQASKTYFGKSASDLSISEAALIAGLFQAPSSYDPYIYPEKAEARRNQVLNLMKRHGYINDEECEIAKSISVKSMLVSQSSSINPYQGYIDTVVSEVIDKYGVDPYKVPLEIYTYFDKNKQDVINNIYNGNYGYEFKDDLIQLGIAVVDNKNGSLIAVGAGRNIDRERGFNRATMINNHPGSTIKPILDYGPAIEYLNWSGYTPIFDEPITYTSGGTIWNWNHKYSGLVTMKYALSESLNTAALQTFQATTNEQKWQFATSLGITPGNKDGKIYESASLGAFEGTNPVQLASAYSAFANGGYYTKAYTISKIVYKESGDTIENTYTRDRVMKETTAYMITDILFNVTPYAAQVYGNQIATKTGTSTYEEDALHAVGIYDYNVVRDSWVATYNPDYTIAFWYGYDELYKDYYNVMSSTTQERNKIQSFLTNNILNTGSRFTVPRGITSVKVELETFPARLASEFTPSSLTGNYYFISGTEPTEVSTRFSKLSDPTKLKVVENGISATLTWTSPGIPDAINNEYLTTYFNTYYKEWAAKYLELRQYFNRDVIGDLVFDIYLRSGTNLTYVGSTSDTTYTIDDTTGYDSVVVKTAYSIFKSNASSGASAELTGATTKFNIEMLAITTSSGDFVNPTFKINEKLPDMGIDTIKFLINDVDMTDTVLDKTYIIQDCTSTCTTVTSIDNTKAGTYQIIYSVVYLGQTYKETRTVRIE